jgi:polyisoprenoid-binding protein YceI
MNTPRNAINTIAAGVAASTLALSATSAQAEPKDYKIDEEHMSISFEVNHLGYASVIGLFLEGKGSFKYDEETNEVPSGKVVIQSASVFSNHDKRDEHLRKEDFLHSDRYPEITFEVTDFETTGERTGNLTGDLTLLGQTRPVTLDVTLNQAAEYPIGHEEYTLGISASTTIKRSDWGMTYALDPLMVGDDVHLRFEFEAIQDNGWF